jgi:hypothetical protein
MRVPDLTYTCLFCEEESPPWDDEPLNLCHYTGRAHEETGDTIASCDCGASTDWVCDNCKCTECGIILEKAVDRDAGTCRPCDPTEPERHWT